LSEIAEQQKNDVSAVSKNKWRKIIGIFKTLETVSSKVPEINKGNK
jgi:hypothetical protein